ncbi:RBBP9/YdeN family alpha/beta hydrolase [Gandjariella thermophila]|uniref:Alpha/beta hydrolase n=1 Tax=Gandjariella thermophila TaxID=1931992 RepID=A0A4D4J9Z2_9PSEU|nr:alpha/beta hydrolase [Gandjariella thermophila]GDY31488.1 hypothetical protein GTS_31210 [Gandjariella thermophila]
MAWPYVLLVHEDPDPGPRHWQSWLAGQLARRGALVDVPTFTDPDRPVRDTWLTELREHLAVAPAAAGRVVLAHSWGATLWLHHAAGRFDRGLRVERVLLVAPPAPRCHRAEMVGFHPVPLDPAGLRRAGGHTRLVVGSDDPACPVADAAGMARALGVDLDVLPHGGHLDPAAGYGAWPAALDWVRTGATPLRAAGQTATPLPEARFRRGG